MRKFELENLFIRDERRQERKWLTRRDKEEKDTWQSFLNNRGNNRKEGERQNRATLLKLSETQPLNWIGTIYFNQAFSALSHTAKKSSVSKIDCRLNFSIVRLKLRQTFQAQSLATLRIRFAKFQIVRGNLRMPSNSVNKILLQKLFPSGFYKCFDTWIRRYFKIGQFLFGSLPPSSVKARYIWFLDNFC